MRCAALAATLALAMVATAAQACEGFTPDEHRQMRIDRNLRERAFVQRVIEVADVVFVGQLVRSDDVDFTEFDSVMRARWHTADFKVERTLQGKPLPTRTVRWRVEAALIRTDDKGAATTVVPEAELERQDTALPPPGQGKHLPDTGAAVGDTVEMDEVRISCGPVDDFDGVRFDHMEGYRFLVYLRHGRVLRATAYEEGPPYLSAADEENLVPLVPDSEP